jgi:hypothetical protein
MILPLAQPAIASRTPGLGRDEVEVPRCPEYEGMHAGHQTRHRADLGAPGGRGRAMPTTVMTSEGESSHPSARPSTIASEQLHPRPRLEVPTQPLQQVADEAALVSTTQGRPPLALVLPHVAPKCLQQLLALHPEFHAPQLCVQRLLLGRRHA